MMLDHTITNEDVKREMYMFDLVHEDEAGHQLIYLPPFYYAKIGVAGKLRKIAATPTTPISIDTAAIEAAVGMHYDDVQIEASKRAVKFKVMILTSGRRLYAQ